MVIILDKKFILIRKRASNSISIYRSTDNVFIARVGNKIDIEHEYYFNRLFYERGFNVPELICKGVLGSRYYFMEKNIGDRHFGEIFNKESDQKIKITDYTMKKFIKCVNGFYITQLTTRQEPKWDNFYRSLKKNKLANEYPILEREINVFRYNSHKSLGNILPFVLTHGDFQAFNIFEKGVIDFESSMNAPLGFDIIKSVYGAFFIPKVGNYEVTRAYQFNGKQINELIKKFIKTSDEQKSPNPFEFIEELLLFNLIWVTGNVNVNNLPKLKQWLIDTLENVLIYYNHGERGKVLNYLVQN